MAELDEKLLDIADRARVALAELIDQQMSPLGVAAMNALRLVQQVLPVSKPVVAIAST